jgi:hypothetical protein
MSLLHVQILVDVVFFVTILLLLHRLSRRIAKRRPVVDVTSINEFKRIMAESQDVTNQFLTTQEDHVRVLNKLLHQLDDRHKTLVMLLAEAEASIKKLESGKTGPETLPPAERYDDVIRMVQQGLGREEVARQSGFTAGEIDLVMELVRARKKGSL